VRWKRRLTLALSITVGLGALAAILYYVGWAEIAQKILALGWLGFLILGLDFLLTFFFWALTWRIILRSYGINSPWWAVFRALLSGYTVSYLTPSMYFGGEPVRVYILAKELDLPQPRLYATVLVAKLLEAITLILFVLLGVFYALFAESLPTVQLQRKSLIYGTVFLGSWVVLGVLNFTLDLRLGTRLLQGLRRLLPWKRALRKAVEKVAEVEVEIHQAFRSFQLPFTALAFLASFAANLLIYLRPQIFFYFAQERVFSFPSLSLLYALSVILAALFWITPGGIGIAEGGRIGIFALVGIGKAGAVAFSFALKAVELIFIILGISLLMEFGLFRWRRRRG